MLKFHFFKHKRIRVLSSDGEGSPEKNPEPVRTVSNGYGFAGMPSPDIVQTRVELLQKSFPNKVSDQNETEELFLSIN